MGETVAKEPSFLQRQWTRLVYCYKYFMALQPRTKLAISLSILIFLITHPETLPEVLRPHVSMLHNLWVGLFMVSWQVMLGRLAAVAAAVISARYLYQRLPEKLIAADEDRVRKSREKAQDKSEMEVARSAEEQAHMEELVKQVADALKASRLTAEQKQKMNTDEIAVREAAQAELERQAQEIQLDQLDLQAKMAALRQDKQTPEQQAEVAKIAGQQASRQEQGEQLKAAAVASAADNKRIADSRQAVAAAEGAASGSAAPPDPKARYLKMQVELDVAAKQRVAEAAAEAAAVAAAEAALAMTPSGSGLDQQPKIGAGEEAAIAAQGRVSKNDTKSAPSAAAKGLGSSAGQGSSGNMIPLAVAQEAAERQRKWLQELDQQVDGPERARRAALEQERLLRAEQDREYLATLEADRKRKEEFEAQKLATEEAEKKVQEAEKQNQMKKEEAVQMEERKRQSKAEQLAALPAAPEAGTPGSVAVKVRLPAGSTGTRRFEGAAPLAEVYAWAALLEDFPPLWEKEDFRLVTSYPKTTPAGTATVEEVAAGAGAIALIVEAV